MLGQNKELAPLGIGFTLMMIVYNYGYNSLGMYNPSVTIAHIIRNSKNFQRDDYIQWIIYFIMQFLGGIAGGFFAAIIGGKDVCMIHTFINPQAKIYEALFAEFFFCSILVSLNIHLATDKRVDGNQFYGIAIGTSLFVSVLCIGDITGSAINPAVWVGTVSSAAFCADDDNELILDNAWIYWIAHIFAGIFYGLWFQLIYGCDDAFGDDDPNTINKGISGSTNGKNNKKQRVRTGTDLARDSEEDSIDIINEDDDDRRVSNVIKDNNDDDNDDYHAGVDTELSPMHGRK